MYSFKSQKNNILLQIWSILTETPKGDGEVQKKMLRNSRILKVQFNFFFSIQRSQFQWQLVIWDKSDFDIHHGKLLSRLIVNHIKLMISLFFLKINSMYLNIPSAMLNEPWDLSTIIPFLLTGWRLNQFYPLRIYKEKCDFFGGRG